MTYELIKDFSEKLCDLSKKLNLAIWDLETSGSKEAGKRHLALSLQYKKLFNDPAIYTKIKSFEGKNHSLDTSRVLNVLERSFRSHLMEEKLLEEISHLESEIMHTYANFRPKLDGEELTENQIRKILEKELDPDKRKRAWRASKEIGNVLAPKILRLVNLRNKGAKQLGFTDYFQMQLILQEVDPIWLENTFEDLHTRSQEAFEKLHKKIYQRLAEQFSVSLKEIGPWALSEPFGQEDPLDTDVLNEVVQGLDFIKEAKEFFRRRGFVKVEEVVDRSDLYERKGKNQHAFCINIDRGKDIRTLNNIRCTMQWLETILHELGHAVYEQGFDPTLPWLLREPPHMITTEAMALLCGREPYQKTFWKDKEIDSQILEIAKTSLARRQLIFSRWVMVMTRFEKELYKNPDQDLNQLWWALVEKYQGIVPIEDRRNHHDWAAKYHIGLAPVYYFSYLLGEMFASSIQATLFEKFPGLGFSSPQAAKFFHEHLFGFGNRCPWYDLVEKTIGKPLSADAWLKEFATI